MLLQPVIQLRDLARDKVNIIYSDDSHRTEDNRGVNITKNLNEVKMFLPIEVSGGNIRTAIRIYLFFHIPQAGSIS
jgi:hypothetical protein